MWKFLGLVAVVMTAALVTAVAAPAYHEDFVCDGSFTDGVYDDVVVPRDGSCTLIGATVAGDVRVSKGAFLHARGTAIGHSIYAREAVTVFVDGGSKVFGSIRTYRADKLFVFDSVVVRSIRAQRTSEKVQICGTTVFKGDVNVERGSRDILIGDPLTVDCAGNLIRRGDLEVERNSTDVEFVIRGNTVRKGELEVIRNNGPAPKFVEDNAGGEELTCRDNSSPFFVGGNTGFDKRRGQCA